MGPNGKGEGRDVSNSGVFSGAAKACATAIGVATIAAPVWAQDAPREFGQTAAGRQFGDQLAPGPDQAPPATAAARPRKAAVKHAKAAAKESRAKPEAAAASEKRPAPSEHAAAKAPISPTPIATAAPASAAPASAAPPAPGAGRGLLYAVVGLLALIVAFLAGLFVARGRRSPEPVGGADELPAVTPKAPAPPPLAAVAPEPVAMPSAAPSASAPARVKRSVAKPAAASPPTAKPTPAIEPPPAKTAKVAAKAVTGRRKPSVV